MKRFANALVILLACAQSQIAQAGVGSFLGSAGRIQQGINDEQERMRQDRLNQLALEEANRRAIIQKMEFDRCVALMRAGQQCPPSSLPPQTSAPIVTQPEALERATRTGQEATGDYSIALCYYRTLRGYEFSVNARNTCPLSVKINPITNMVYEDR